MFAGEDEKTRQIQLVNVAVNQNETEFGVTVESDESGDVSSLLGFWTVVFNLITCVVGVAVFGLPSMATKGGVYFTCAAMVMATWCTHQGGCLYYGAVTEWNKAHHPSDHIRSFETFGYVAAGNFGRIVCSLSNCIWCFGLSTAFVVHVGNVVHTLLALDMEKCWVRLWFCPLYFGLCMFRSLKGLERVAPIAITAVFVACGAIIVKAAIDLNGWKKFTDPAPQSGVINLYPSDWMSSGTVLAIAFSAYGIMGPIGTQHSEMAHKERMPAAITITCVTVCALYISIILLGHYAYGNFVCDEFIQNMRRYPSSFSEAFSRDSGDSSCGLNFTGLADDIWFNVASYSVVVNLIFSYPLTMMTLFSAMQAFGSYRKSAPVGSKSDFAFRVVLVSATVLVAFAADKLTVVLGFFGALTLPVSTVYLPVIFAWRIRSKLGVAQPGKMRLCALSVLFVFAILSNVFGVWDSLREASAAWE